MGNVYALDTSKCPKELEEILAILRVQGSSPPVQTDGSDIDWKHFFQLAKHHRVYPTLYARLNKLESGRIPASVLQALRAQYNKNMFQMLHLSAEMERVCSSMDKQQIRTLTLKGPVLAQELYGDLSLRTSKDLDILVHIREVEQAELVLEELGYVIQDNPVRVLDWKWKFYHIAYYHPQKQVEIELHWSLNPDMAKEEPQFEELWARRRVSSLGSGTVFYLGSEDLFFYLVSHGSRHGWFRLRWLEDIDRLVRKGIDAKALHALLKQYKSVHLGGQAFILASQLLDTPLTEEMRSLFTGRRSLQLAQSTLLFIYTMAVLCPDPPPELAKPFRSYLLSLKNRKQKWTYYLNRMYPSSKDALMLPLPKALHFLYFPLRPFLWCWRQIKQQSSL
ncbi:nucleotidyltransferase domain-containing protein [Paenibacillus sedimenti]|uniref:Nucleotidyltransferase family protein n=1 Tax=Paenibacillus sedimenti TaxID=2770274 RepID=A0A926QHQ5_9BACL|nr:nucleotidyltransferase family protein [Paenibacillus sedimenti]MBD0379750.1 nucleotidyltransferase family protein [Paenibacillus sedimenti]